MKQQTSIIWRLALTLIFLGLGLTSGFAQLTEHEAISLSEALLAMDVVNVEGFEIIQDWIELEERFRPKVTRISNPLYNAWGEEEILRSDFIVLLIEIFGATQIARTGEGRECINVYGDYFDYGGDFLGSTVGIEGSSTGILLKKLRKTAILDKEEIRQGKKVLTNNRGISEVCFLEKIYRIVIGSENQPHREKMTNAAKDLLARLDGKDLGQSSIDQYGRINFTPFESVQKCFYAEFDDYRRVDTLSVIRWVADELMQRVPGIGIDRISIRDSVIRTEFTQVRKVPFLSYRVNNIEYNHQLERNYAGSSRDVSLASIGNFFNHALIAEGFPERLLSFGNRTGPKWSSRMGFLVLEEEEAALLSQATLTNRTKTLWRDSLIQSRIFIIDEFRKLGILPALDSIRERQAYATMVNLPEKTPLWEVAEPYGLPLIKFFSAEPISPNVVTEYLGLIAEQVEGMTVSECQNEGADFMCLHLNNSTTKIRVGGDPNFYLTWMKAVNSFLEANLSKKLELVDLPGAKTPALYVLLGSDQKGVVSARYPEFLWHSRIGLEAKKRRP